MIVLKPEVNCHLMLQFSTNQSQMCHVIIILPLILTSIVILPGVVLNTKAAQKVFVLGEDIGQQICHLGVVNSDPGSHG